MALRLVVNGQLVVIPILPGVTVPPPGNTSNPGTGGGFGGAFGKSFGG